MNSPIQAVRPSVAASDEVRARRRFSPLNPMRRRVAGLIRLTAYVFFASLLCAGLGARVVFADLREASLQLGRELEPVSDVLGTTKTIFINGAQMNISTAQTTQSPKEVLDRFEALCNEHPEFLARAFAEIPETLARKVPAAKAAHLLSAMRSEARNDGAVACFMDDRPSTMNDVPARLKAFAKNGDLSEFGHFRYVYVNGQKPGQTAVRTVWTDGAVPLKEMFPREGDAAGFDSPALPRAPEARRIFSATSLQVPFGVHIYDSGKSEADLLNFYDEQLTAFGWTRVGVPSNPDTVAYFLDSAHAIYLSFQNRGPRTLVTTIETAHPGIPSGVAVQVQ